jgi:hypothetical protein
MKKILSRTIRPALTTLAALFLAVVSAWAGPPLICHAFDIGNAKSLPWVSHDWNLNGGENYDTKNLPDDTVAILERGSKTALVHMETLRRATLYARQDPAAAKQLLLRLTARAEASASSAAPDALSIFDAGYLAEAYKQWLGEGSRNPANGMDGYALVKKAIHLKGSDAQMEFAAALITLSGPGAEHEAHAAKALAGAKTDQLLAQNLDSRFLGRSQTMAEMITRGSEAKVAKQ